MNSSPFELFRRNLKPLMVLLTLLALFSFVALPPLLDYMQRRDMAGTADLRLATYDGGHFDANQAANFTMMHHLMLRFLQEAALLTIERGGTPRVAGFQYDSQQGEIRSLGVHGNPNDQVSIVIMRRAEQARQAGFDLDDRAVGAWLNDFTDGRLTEAEINRLLQTSTRNQMGMFHLQQQLRAHLLMQAYDLKVDSGFRVGNQPIVSPSHQWDLFLRLNRRAVVDAVAVPVADFLDQTDPQPPQEELRRVYQDGKDRYPDPDSPRPAFRQPYKADFEYVSGQLEAFIDKEIKQLTDEQLQAEYQRRLDGGDFRMPETPPEETPQDAEPASPETPGDEPASEPVDRSDDDQASDNEDDTDAAPTDDPTPEDPAADDPSTDDAAAEDSPAEDSPADSEPAGDDQGAEPGASDEQPADSGAADEDSQSMRYRSGLRLVAARPQQDGDDQPSLNAPGQDESAQDESAQDDSSQDDSADDNASAAEEQADEQDRADDADPPATAEGDMPGDADSAEGEADEEDEVPMRTQVFEEVRDEIARSLAREPAREKLEAALDEVDRVMRHYFTARTIAADQDEQPARPDLEAMAERLGLSYGQTGMVDFVAMREMDLGRSRVPGTGMQQGGSFLELMFLTRRQLFSVAKTNSPVEEVTYLAWKTDEKDEYTPSLDEIRDDVVMAIRTAEAGQLAKAEAERLAAEFNQSEAPFAELVPEDKSALVFESVGPFSWMESFGFAMQAFMGNVEELDNVGEAFMRRVFTSGRGQWGAAPNADETVYYVVRPSEFSPSTEELYNRFSQAINRFMASQLAVQDLEAVRQGYWDAVDERSGFQWNEEALRER